MLSGILSNLVQTVYILGLRVNENMTFQDRSVTFFGSVYLALGTNLMHKTLRDGLF